MLFMIGIKVKKVKHSIHDFVADYKPKQDLSVAPIAIANHVCPHVDPFYSVSEPFSFVARELVSKAFYIGMFCTARQSLYVSRSTKQDRDNFVKALSDRIEKSMKGLLPPVFLFPEGTTTNGEAFLTFKRGAFLHKYPLKMFCLDYQGKFRNSFTNIHPLVSLLISLGQFDSRLVIHEIEEPLDPLWIAEKRGVDINDAEFWRHFADEARDIMSWVSNNQLTNEGFRDLLKFEKDECRKHFDIAFDICNREGKKKVQGKSKLGEAMDKKTA